MRLAVVEGRATRRVTCTCGAFLAIVEARGLLRLELPRCGCGVWPLIAVDSAGQLVLRLYGRREDQERA